MWEVPELSCLEDPRFCDTAGSMEVILNYKVKSC